MPTELLSPYPQSDDEGLDPFAGERGAYTFGGCGPFAVALQEITGWEMVALDLPELPYAHVGVRAPDGAIWDARGKHENPLTFVQPFTPVVPEEGLRVFTFEQLCRDHPGAAHWGDTHERIASMMLPELPHLPTSDRSRNIAFMDGVEALSRRHNVWIRAIGAAHMWPVIGEEFDGIAGYRAAFIGGVATFDRMLISEVVRGPSHVSRHVDRFLRELEALSRAHQLWLRASLPTTWPQLVELSGTVFNGAHYAITPTWNGGGFLANLVR